MKSNDICDYCDKKLCGSCDYYDGFFGLNLEPVRRHGQWVLFTEPDENGNAQYVCSICGTGDEHAVSQTVPYCWSCGAKMVVERGNLNG